MTKQRITEKDLQEDESLLHYLQDSKLENASQKGVYIRTPYHAHDDWKKFFIIFEKKQNVIAPENTLEELEGLLKLFETNDKEALVEKHKRDFEKNLKVISATVESLDNCLIKEVDEFTYDIYWHDLAISTFAQFTEGEFLSSQVSKLVNALNNLYDLITDHELIKFVCKGDDLYCKNVFFNLGDDSYSVLMDDAEGVLISWCEQLPTYIENLGIADKQFNKYGELIHLSMGLRTYCVTVTYEGKSFMQNNRDIQNLASDIHRFLLWGEKLEKAKLND